MYKSQKALTCVLILVALGALGFAGEPEGSMPGAEKELYFGAPACLYGQNSLFGLQGGYRSGNWQVRLDLNLAEDYRNGRDCWAFMPSVGFFYSQDVGEKIRFYEGLAFGMEKGIENSFQGTIGFMNYIAGAELIAFGDKTFFVEVGSGISFPQDEGAYNGGTIVGGGFRYYF
ncbi:MAG TPA: hypothetical protein DIC34_18400 [Treponema sp.]|nr:MAG: hypothetical protein A2001_05000 [Treponema sp. GWC1_61_84]OHE74611.1 MAG: hypothetical protein A2413_19100 [Treponema sp. RIFOXYC1_FULL_61_9]HCM28471.1 hypothetical protein [Treponema sp.]